jgi:hypothetical protein
MMQQAALLALILLIDRAVTGLARFTLDTQTTTGAIPMTVLETGSAAALAVIALFQPSTSSSSTSSTRRRSARAPSSGGGGDAPPAAPLGSADPRRLARQGDREDPLGVRAGVDVDEAGGAAPRLEQRGRAWAHHPGRAVAVA